MNLPLIVSRESPGWLGSAEGDGGIAAIAPKKRARRTGRHWRWSVLHPNRARADWMQDNDRGNVGQFAWPAFSAAMAAMPPSPRADPSQSWLFSWENDHATFYLRTVDAGKNVENAAWGIDTAYAPSMCISRITQP